MAVDGSEDVRQMDGTEGMPDDLPGPPTLRDRDHDEATSRRGLPRNACESEVATGPG